MVSTAYGNDGLFIWKFNGDVTDKQSPNVPEIKVIAKQFDNPSSLYEEVNETVEEIPAVSQYPFIPIPQAKSLSLSLNRVISYPQNLLWASENGCFFYTSGNKIIQTLLRENATQLILEAPTSLTCLALSSNFTYIAAGSNIPGSTICIYDILSQKLIKNLSFHEKGVKNMSFSSDGRYLLSLGTSEESILVVWEVSSGRVMATSILDSTSEAAK